MQFKIFLLAASAAIANAAAPTTQCTNGCNPISKPSLGENVPVGAPYTITWNPTTAGTVSIQLLKGPSTNVLPIGPQIVSGIANVGTYSWTPASDLEQSLGSGYGLQLISDIDGTFQYSVQFGISNSGVVSNVSASDSAPVSASVSAAAAPSDSVYGYDYAPKAPKASNATTSYLPSVTISKYVVASTGYPLGNTSIIAPTGSLTVPSSLQTSSPAVATSSKSDNATTASSTTKNVATGAASQLGMSLGSAVVALAVAIFVL